LIVLLRRDNRVHVSRYVCNTESNNNNNNNNTEVSIKHKREIYFLTFNSVVSTFFHAGIKIIVIR